MDLWNRGRGGAGENDNVDGGTKRHVAHELHPNVLTVNFGLCHQLTDARVLIASIGHELRDPDQARSFIGYLGVQLLY
jgi:hypothetical protein